MSDHSACTVRIHPHSCFSVHPGQGHDITINEHSSKLDINTKKGVKHLGTSSFSLLKMSSWTHLVRFLAVEDNQIHLGQLIDTDQDVGRDSVDGKKIAVYLIDGTIFDGRVTKEIFHVRQVWTVDLSPPISFHFFLFTDPRPLSYYHLCAKKTVAIFAVLA